MSERMPTTPLSDNPTAVLMTNEMNQVVFVDSRFLGLMSYSQAGVIVGEPLHKALGWALNTASELVQELKQTGHLPPRVVELQAAGGGSVRVVCTGIATYDHQGTFLGADLSLQWVNAASVIGAQETPHAETPNAEDMIRLESYFLAYVQAIQAFLVMLGGQRFRVALKTMVNDTAEQNGWPVRLLDDYVNTEVSVTETSLQRQAEIYAALLTRAILYAVRIAGKNRVAKEIKAIDAKTDPQVRAIARQLGLPQAVIALLN